MRQKYEVEADAKGEELEMTTMKITDRKTEAEATNNNLNARRAKVEKAKIKIKLLKADMKRKAEAFDTFC